MASPHLVKPAPRASADPVCEVCGQGSVERWLTKGRYEFLRCRGCGLGFVWPVPTAEEIAAVYDRDYLHRGGTFGYQESERSRAKQQRNQVRRWRTLLVRLGYRGRRALDFGSGDGWWLAGLKPDHDLVRGIEHSAVIRRECDARIGPGHAVASVEELPEGECYDLVTFFDSLEHLPRPAATLDAVLHRLLPGGFVAVVTPVADHWTARISPERWDQVKPPEHLYYFTRGSLDRLLRCRGLDVVHVESAWSRWPRPLPHLPTWAQYPFRIPMKLLARWSETIDRGIADSLFVAARRPGSAGERR